jgi:cytoskeleton protein RodZ
MSESEAPVESAAPVPGIRPGRALAEARDRRNQTIAEIAQQLKLSATQVEALEADDYAKLPGPVFVRGFVRNYARLMELDSETLVAGLTLPQDPLTSGASLPHSHNIPFPDGRGPRWPIFAVAIAVLAAIVVLFEFFYSSSPAVVVDTPQPKANDSQPVTPTPDAAPVTAPLPVIAPSAPAATEPAEPAATPPAKRAGVADVKMAFDAQSWVEVRDRDDRIVFSQLNPAGAVQHVQGQPPLNVVIGNASGVKVIYNGKPVDLSPHTRVEVARFTLD